MRTWIIGNAHNSIGAELQDLFIKEAWIGSDTYGTGTNVNVTHPNQIRQFVSDYAPFDNIVYCAGIAQLQWIKDWDPDDALHVFNVNVIGFVNVMRELVQVQESGNVVVLISDSSKTPMRGSMAYCASKAALVMATKVAARELAPNWRINGVSPSAVDGTGMTDWIDAHVPIFRGWDLEKAREYELSSIPMGRRATKNEVAQAIIDVIQGPTFMTGSIIELTGGK